MEKKKPDLLKFIREGAPIITEELTEIDSLASANECTGMGKIFPCADDEELNEVFHKSSENTRRLNS